MNKKIVVTCFTLAVSMALMSGCSQQDTTVDVKEDKKEATTIEVKEDKGQKEDIKIESRNERRTSWGTDSERKNFEVFLRASTAMYDGVEMWEKGKKIGMNIKSEDELELQVGLMEIIDENTFEFGDIISESVHITNGTGEIYVEVPETKKYAIYIKNVGDESIEFNLELDTPLTQPLV